LKCGKGWEFPTPNAPSAAAAFPINHIYDISLTENRSHWHSDPLLDERRSQGARHRGRIRLAIGETEGISLEGRDREIILRHEGLAPVLLPRLENRFGLFQADVFLPDIGSIGLSFSVGSRVMVSWPGDPGGLPFSRSSGAAAGRSGGKGAHASAILKTAPALHLPHETGGPRNEDERERRRGANKQRHRCAPWLPSRREAAAERKKGLGGRKRGRLPGGAIRLARGR